uniref:IAP7 n=1 Tax=Botryllus schlosseri TaxID=30301 RepID=A0A165NNI7_BOTSH|nr:IAP7 [Botryllus schlosseri]
MIGSDSRRSQLQAVNGSGSVSTSGIPTSSQGGLSANHGLFTDIFNCANPTSPAYTGKSQRLSTFKNWNKHNILSPDKLADAGLFYLGERDRCKCFYCNGGLQNWVAGDDPMEEHAKYFPQCEYVLSRMGPDYVANLNARYPNLTRPTIPSPPPQMQYDARPITLSPPSSAVHRPQNVQSSPSLSRSPAAASQSHIDQDLAELVSQAEQFGFDRSIIEEILSDKYRSTGCYHSSLTELIDDIIRKESGITFDPQPMEDVEVECHETIRNPPIACVAEGRSCGNVESDSPLRDQLQSAINVTRCMSCNRRNRDCLFLDCGHLCCCYECGKAKQRCVICGTRVREVIKIFTTSFALRFLSLWLLNYCN